MHAAKGVCPPHVDTESVCFVVADCSVPAAGWESVVIRELATISGVCGGGHAPQGGPEKHGEPVADGQTGNKKVLPACNVYNATAVVICNAAAVDLS